ELSRVRAPTKKPRESLIGRLERLRYLAMRVLFRLRALCPCRAACTDNRLQSVLRSTEEMKLLHPANCAVSDWCATPTSRAHRCRAQPERPTMTAYSNSQPGVGPFRSGLLLMCH